MKNIRRAFAVASLMVTGIALGIPEGITIERIPVSKMFLSIATALNAVNLYLLKEEAHEATP